MDPTRFFSLRPLSIGKWWNDPLSLWAEESARSRGDVALDVGEDDASYFVRADLPGASIDEISIHVQGDRLALEHTPAGSDGAQDARRWHWCERHRTPFRRELKFATEIQSDKVEATLKDGVLEITLPKSEQHVPRRIAVRSAGR